MGFPNKKEIEKRRKKLENSEGSLALDKDASPLEVFRFDICQKFIKYKTEHEITQKALAEELGVDEAKVSKILRHRINEFSTDRLIDLYSRINPEVKLKVS